MNKFIYYATENNEYCNICVVNRALYMYPANADNPNKIKTIHFCRECLISQDFINHQPIWLPVIRKEDYSFLE